MSSCQITTTGGVLPVGSACSRDNDCASLSAPLCLQEYKPLQGLVSNVTDREIAASYELVGLEFPGGYCSSANNCATDDDCGQGGRCYRLLAGVPSEILDAAAPTFDFDIQTLAERGVCLRACSDSSQCRQGYGCRWPMGDFLTRVPEATSQRFCVADSEVNPCKPNPCQNGGSCSSPGGNFVCACPDGFSGDRCEVKAIRCDSSPCKNGAVCADTIDGFLCHCQPGFSGASCETNDDECAVNPCQNGGACSDALNDFVCNCRDGYVGKKCEYEANGCNPPNPCLNGGTCVEGEGHAFTCQCKDGYSGLVCAVNVDDCAPNPCQNGGSCVDGVGDASCRCLSGFVGQHCEINVDDCALNPCQNGGTCTDGVNDFSCQCLTGTSGKRCDRQCGASQLITYSLSGVYELTETGGGDGTWELPGTAARSGGTPLVTHPAPNLVLRLHSDGVHVSLISFDLPHNVKQSAGGMDFYSNVLHTIPVNVCGTASGALSNSILTWDVCNTPPTYGTKDWDVKKANQNPSGPGCASDWGDIGNVWCSGSSLMCGFGGFKSGDNAVTRPPVWNQPLSPFVFASNDLKHFTAQLFDVPNDKPGRSRISLTGTEVSRSADATPECACQ